VTELVTGRHSENTGVEFIERKVLRKVVNRKKGMKRGKNRKERKTGEIFS